MKSSILNKKETILYGVPFSASARRGMTLIEILVVVGIMMVLMAVSVPVLAPVAESRVARESARGVQSALESARARAIRLGRPCGVSLVPFHTDYRNACISVEQLTAPPSVSTTYSVGSGSISVSLGDLPKLTPGSSVQLNFSGPRFVATSTGNTIDTRAWYHGEQLEYDFSRYGSETERVCTVNYFPISEVNNKFAKALGLETAYTLPKGYIVDLYFCGVGDSAWNGNIGTNPKLRPPMIIFNPDGTAALYVDGAQVSLENNTNDPRIYLLVGSWERMHYGGGTLAEDGKSNIQVYDSFWVVVNPKTGLVTTAINDASGNVSGARSFAKNGILKGGN